MTKEATYTVHELADLSGVTVRTLHYYDEKGLLSPMRDDVNRYRRYDTNDVDRLQQILLYREFGMDLARIKQLLDDKKFDKKQALLSHKKKLLQQKNQIDALIRSIDKTLESLERSEPMNDKEKFEGFKQKLVDDNEKTYGKEIRESYGDDTVNASNAKLKGMSQQQWDANQKLSEEINSKLAQAVGQGGPSSRLAQEVCDLHRQWLCFFWADGIYSKEAHRSMGEMYVADARFKKYYDDITPGAAEFLKQALDIYCA